MMTGLLPLFALAAYLLATGSVLMRLFHPKGPHFKLMFSAGILGLVLHMLALTQTLFTPAGQNFSLINVSSLVCWLVTVAVTVTALRTPTILLLPVVYGFAALIQIATLLVPQDLQLQHFEQDISLLVHISLAFLAYVVLTMATLYSFQVSYISTKLKQKDFTPVSQYLPPLMQAETIQFRLLMAGTVLLGIALAIGVVFIENWLGNANLHKTILSTLAFLVFASLCWGHARKGWRGRTAITLMLIGTSLLTLAYFGSRFVKEVIIDRLG
ncbi:cytochrome C assembly family protein [Arsukibacterium perlucidum]|uniref:cytochrome C assembly family protein n=1 Tax=Arsukibacterium perlucidum TaxID=368811 RepID=UPI0003625CA8|nr:cytochrome c biogenesis protein CcsA [Arsukibacterium perlucidum]